MRCGVTFVKDQKACGFFLVFIALASLTFVGCVRVIVNTPMKGIVAPDAPPYPEQSLLVHEINHLSRFGDSETAINKGEVEEILSYASLVARCGEDNDDFLCALEFTDMGDDFGCNIGFQLNNSPLSPIELPNWPPIFTFPSAGISVGENPPEDDPLNCLADGVICSQSDLDAVWGVTPQNDGIKIVRDILFCGNTRFNWAGCAQFPEAGQAIAITRHPDKDLKVEGILWLHEFGHTKGLRHTPNGLNRNSKAVMSPEIGVSKTKLKRKECYKLRGGFP